MALNILNDYIDNFVEAFFELPIWGQVLLVFAFICFCGFSVAVLMVDKFGGENAQIICFTCVSKF